MKRMMIILRVDNAEGEDGRRCLEFADGPVSERVPDDLYFLELLQV